MTLCLDSMFYRFSSFSYQSHYSVCDLHIKGVTKVFTFLNIANPIGGDVSDSSTLAQCVSLTADVHDVFIQLLELPGVCVFAYMRLLRASAADETLILLTVRCLLTICLVLLKLKI